MANTVVDGAPPIVRRAVSSPRGERPGPMQSVERVSAVLLSFTTEGPVLKLSDIARRLGLPKSAVHRILDSLVQTGFVLRDPESLRYRLGPRAVELGMAAVGAPDVPAFAEPLMRSLAQETGETTTVSLRVGYERIYAAQVESTQTVRMTVEVGKRCPLYAGASGRAILAALSDEELDLYLSGVDRPVLTGHTIVDASSLRATVCEVREIGYASSAGERDASAAAVAATIRSQSGRLIGSLSICGPITRFTPDKVAAYGGLLRNAALELARRIP